MGAGEENLLQKVVDNLSEFSTTVSIVLLFSVIRYCRDNPSFRASSSVSYLFVSLDISSVSTGPRFNVSIVYYSKQLRCNPL